MVGQKIAALRRLRTYRRYKRLFATEDGRFVLADLIRSYHVLRPCWTPEEEGERRVVVQLLRVLSMTADEVTALMRATMEDETP